MSFLEFIKYIRISSKDNSVESVELTSAQQAFLNWIERCKKKGLNPFMLKGRV